MRILTWNLAWAIATSTKGQEIIRRIEEVRPDVAIFTEVTVPLVEALGGNAAYSDSDHGYRVKPTRRKVALWARSSIAAADTQGHPDLPPGRFISAYVENLRFIGVCIPWRDAHVRTGRKDAAIWAEHLRYIDALHRLIKSFASSTVLGGDLNQRRPQHGQPEHVVTALDQALGCMTWATAGAIGPSGQQAIDHIVSTPDLEAYVIGIVPNQFGAGKVSDHFGVYCEINRAA